MKDFRPAMVALLLALLPTAYLGSYFALVQPGGHFIHYQFSDTTVDLGCCRIEGKWVQRFYFPLEQVDRSVRPREWELSKHNLRYEIVPWDK